MRITEFMLFSELTIDIVEHLAVIWNSLRNNFLRF